MTLSLAVTILLFYAFVIWYLIKSWRFLPDITSSGELKSVCIVVPFRNEAANLTKLLFSFSQIQYPSSLLQIILVNDHSEDPSVEIIKQQTVKFPFQVEVFNLPDDEKGKKSAINFAIQKAQAEIILMTDADCEMQPNWVEQMQAPFDSERIQLVSGNVVFNANNFIQKIFQMEFAPLIGVGAVAIVEGKAIMANGANLAVRKQVFEDLNPYADNMNIPGGDDIFLLNKVTQYDAEGLFFQKNAIVTTAVPVDLKQFFHQRLRWASKWKAAANPMSRIPALLVGLFHLGYLLLIAYFVWQNMLLFLLPVILLKAVLEAIFIKSILNVQAQQFSWPAFIFLQIFYSFYVVIFGLFANFISYQWKGRKYGKNE